MDNTTESDRLKLVEPLEPQKRAKSSQRMKYSAEIALIKEKWGDLEAIRTKLGLSQRKIAQLLMVDPSAWTRWTKLGDDVPPHIYRSLSWFLTLQEKHPEAHPYFWLAGVSRPQIPQHEILELKQDVRNSVQIELRNKYLVRILMVQGVTIALFAAIAGYLFIWR